MPFVPVELLYHILPLHYLPHLFATGSLYSQAELKRRNLPVYPRTTAARRDRKLHLDDYVHLSPRLKTPLLSDKRGKGFPHVLLIFPSEICLLPGMALVRYNPKSWRHREDFEPVANTQAQEETWSEWLLGKYPSLSVLSPRELPLRPYLCGVAFGDSWQQDWAITLCNDLEIVLPVSAERIEQEASLSCAFDREPYLQYSRSCRAANTLLPPPLLPFD